MHPHPATTKHSPPIDPYLSTTPTFTPTMPSPQPTSKIHTYHCLCSTLLLATPYPLPTLPRRASPSLDRACILPLPPLSPSPTDANNASSAAAILPSLLTPNMRPARKVVIVRREDGFERRRLFRCGRCGVGVGYEILGDAETEAGGKERERVVYLLEGGLVESEDMGVEGEGEEGVTR